MYGGEQHEAPTLGSRGFGLVHMRAVLLLYHGTHAGLYVHEVCDNYALHSR